MVRLTYFDPAKHAELSLVLAVSCSESSGSLGLNARSGGELVTGQEGAEGRPFGPLNGLPVHNIHDRLLRQQVMTDNRVSVGVRLLLWPTA